MSERMSFSGYWVFLDGQVCKSAMAKLDDAELCAVAPTMVRIDDRIAWIHGIVWASLSMWDPT